MTVNREPWTLLARTAGSATDGPRVVMAALIAVLAVACSVGPTPPNVVLIVIDTLRADHLGSYGYPLDTSPNFDRLASESLKFNYAISPAPWTSPSMASLFTGYYPTAHGVTQHVARGRMPDDAISPDLVTLAEVFREGGYTTSGITANAWVSDARGYDQGFDSFDTIDYSTAQVVNTLAFKHLELIQQAQPFFLYVHYMDPHPPLSAPPKLTQIALQLHAALPPDKAIRSHQIEKIAAYDAEIFFLDHYLGEFLEHLKLAGLYDDMVIAVVADHGYPFNEHGVDTHGFKLHNEDTHVPLLLKLPGRSGEVDQTVSTIDVFPTLARFVGLEVPEGIQGVSLLDDLDKRRALGAFSENTVRTRNHRSLVTHDARKLILAFDKGAHEVVHREDEKEVVGLFRSREDYGETRPLDDPAQIDGLRARLWSIYDESLARNRLVTPAHAELDARTVEELERLGYVE
jgi:arylsulfatase A-like enzyme